MYSIYADISNTDVVFSSLTADLLLNGRENEVDSFPISVDNQGPAIVNLLSVGDKGINRMTAVFNIKIGRNRYRLYC